MGSDGITANTFDSLPGPILLDGLFQSFLLGTIVNQAFKYAMDYREDSVRKRAFVATVIVLSILQTLLEDYKSWRSLIQHKKWSTSRIQWADLFLNGCICWLCECFYIRRCWKMMERSAVVLLPLSSLSLLIMSANVYLAVAMALVFKNLEGTNDTLASSHFLMPSIMVVFSFWIFVSLVLEIAVTSILIRSLWKSRTGLAEIDKTVHRIIFLTWESSILPSILMIISVGLYHAAPQRSDHLVLFFVLLTGKFYAFGMLRTLNARARLHSGMNSHDLGRTSLSSWQWASSSTHVGRQLSIPKPPQSFDPTKAVEPTATRSIESLRIHPLVPFVSTLEIHNTLGSDESQGSSYVRQRVCS